MRLVRTLRVLTPVVVVATVVLALATIYFSATDQPQLMLLGARLTILELGAFMAVWVVTVIVAARDLRRRRAFRIVVTAAEAGSIPGWAAEFDLGLRELGFVPVGSYEVQGLEALAWRSDVYASAAAPAVVAGIGHKRQNVVFGTYWPGGGVIETSFPGVYHINGRVPQLPPDMEAILVDEGIGPAYDAHTAAIGRRTATHGEPFAITDFGMYLGLDRAAMLRINDFYAQRFRRLLVLAAVYVCVWLGLAWFVFGVEFAQA